jgi:LysM repeat protein
MGFKTNRVIWILLTVFLVAALLVGCNRSATQPDDVEETTTEQESQETPVQTMPTPTAQAGADEPAATTEEPTEEAAPTEQPTEPAEPAPEPTEPPAEEPTPVEEAEPGPVAEQTYVVMPGDTLFSIAQTYGVTVEELAARNGIVNVNILEVGQQLVIPVEGSEPPQAPVSGEQTYVVQAGDNLFRIALRYSMSFETVAAYNNIPWPYFVYVGQEIKIPPVP